MKLLAHFYNDGDAMVVVAGSKLLGKIAIYVVGGFFGTFLGLGRMDKSR